GDFLILDQTLECVISFTTQIAYGHLGFLALGTYHLGEVTPPFFRQWRHGDTNALTHGYWVQTEVRFPDGLFHGAGHALFPDLNVQGARINNGNVRHLVDGHHGTVVFDTDVIQNACGCTACADLGQTCAQGLDRFRHAAVG